MAKECQEAIDRLRGRFMVDSRPPVFSTTCAHCSDGIFEAIILVSYALYVELTFSTKLGVLRMRQE